MSEEISLTIEQKIFRMLIFLFILILGVAFLLLQVINNTDVQRHTFIVIQPSDDLIIETLNSYGAQGCTIVGSRRAVTDDVAGYEIILQCPGVTQ